MVMYVRVIVTPGAKKERVQRTPQGFEISVREKRERNLANLRVREILASEYGIPSSRVRLVMGHRSTSKLFDILLE